MVKVWRPRIDLDPDDSSDMSIYPSEFNEGFDEYMTDLMKNPIFGTSSSTSTDDELTSDNDDDSSGAGGWHPHILWAALGRKGMTAEDVDATISAYSAAYPCLSAHASSSLPM